MQPLWVGTYYLNTPSPPPGSTRKGTAKEKEESEKEKPFALKSKDDVSFANAARRPIVRKH